MRQCLKTISSNKSKASSRKGAEDAKKFFNAVFKPGSFAFLCELRAFARKLVLVLT
jgi:hypothetical protein